MKSIYINEHQLLVDQVNEVKNTVEQRLLESTMQKLDYCYFDIFKIRKEKITAAALQGTSINEDALFPEEQEYYAALRRAEYLYQQNFNLSELPINTSLSPDKNPASPLPNLLSPIATSTVESPSNYAQHTELDTSQFKDVAVNLDRVTQEETTTDDVGGNYISIRFLSDEDADYWRRLTGIWPVFSGGHRLSPRGTCPHFHNKWHCQPIFPGN